MKPLYTLVIGLSCVIHTMAVDLSATCIILPNSGLAPVQGTVHLTQADTGGPTTIQIHLMGFNSSYPNGTKHGFHVHTNGNIGNLCNDVGSHFNPFNQVHGAPTDSVRHVGDLGNVNADSNGVVDVNITDNLVSLVGNISVVGKAFVVHELEDDMGRGGSPFSNTTGNAGKRYGCCVIILDSTNSIRTAELGLNSFSGATNIHLETGFILLALISSVVYIS